MCPENWVESEGIAVCSSLRAWLLFEVHFFYLKNTCRHYEKEDWDHLRTKQWKYNLYVNSLFRGLYWCQRQICYPCYFKNSWPSHWKFSSKSKTFSILFLLHISVRPMSQYSAYSTCLWTYKLTISHQTIPPLNRISLHCILIFLVKQSCIYHNCFENLFKTTLMKWTHIQRTIHI